MRPHLVGLACAAAAIAGAAPLSRAPIAVREPRARELHGDRVVDEYGWLRDRKSPRTLAYLRAERRYADEAMRPTRALQKKIYAEILSRTREDDRSPPFRRGAFEYATVVEKGKEHWRYSRRAVATSGPDAGRAIGPESTVLDVDALARGHAFMEVGLFTPSDDGRLLAYSTDDTGAESYTLFVKDLGSGRLLGDRIGHVVTMAWAADNRTLFYAVEDGAKRAHRVYRHRLGEPRDVLLYEERDARFAVAVDRTRDGALVLLESASHTTSEVRYLPADRPEAPLTVVLPREQDHEYDVEHRRGTLYVRTNRGARNFRIVTAPLADPAVERWRELVPHREDTFIDGIDLFDGFLVAEERARGEPQLRVLELDGAGPPPEHLVPLDEAVRDVSLEGNYVFDAKTFRYQYSSPVTPPTWYDYDPRTRARTLVKREEIPGGYDASRYEVARIDARAPDGTPVPISLLHKKGLLRDGSAPLLLEGYGAYGIVRPTTFDANAFSLVDRGVTYAVAHIRGGGELGKRWHDDGRLMNKRNSFTDFIAAAEHLVDAGYTSKDRLAILGGSAGGLLVGAVLNLRPDLFRAAVAEVPFVDVVNSMLDESLPLTVGEFEEWGNPKEADAYRYMRGYCPYENVAKGGYPSLLVTSALNDARAGYWEAAKWVARLRACKTDANPLLFKIDLTPAGHGGPSGRYQQIAETAYTYTFVLGQLGIRQ